MRRLRLASLYVAPLLFGLRQWARALGIIRDPADQEPDIIA